MGKRLVNLSIHRLLAMSVRFVPEGEFNPIPEPKLIVDSAKIILHDVFGRSDGLGYFFVLQAFGNEFDDSVFTFTWDTVPIASI